MAQPGKLTANKRIKVAKYALIQRAIICFLLVFFVAGIELQYRLKYGKNDSETITWGHKVKNNGLGFRERDLACLALSQGNSFNILVLGDSLTWGVGLPEGKRYSNLLEAFLQAEYPSRKINVLNCALTGGSTVTERDALRSIYKRNKIDLIIIGFCLNDPQEKSQVYSNEREYYFRKLGPFLTFLNRHAMRGTAKLISKAYENVLLFSKRMPSWPVALDRTYDRNAPAWHRFESALEEISAMSREVSLNPPIFISLNLGTSDRVPTDYNSPDDRLLKKYLQWHHQAESAARAKGFIVVNCEEEFKKHLKNHIMAVVPGEDGHPTAEMNRIYAQKLFSVIKNNKLLDERN